MPTTYATWNPADKHAGVTLSNGDLTAVCASPWRAVRATQGKTTGKHYYEITCDDSTYTMFSLCTSAAALDNYSGIGIYGVDLMSGGGGWYIAGGSIFTNNGKTAPTVNNGGIVSIAVDFDAGKIWFGLNGTWVGSGDPAAGTDWCFSFTPGTELFPNTALENGQCTANFGASALSYSAPSGYNSGWYEESVTEIDASIVISPLLSGTMIRGLLGDINASIVISPLLSGTINKELTPEITGSIVISPLVSATIRSSDVGDVAVTIPMLTLSATGLLGIDGVLYLNIPMLELEAEGYDECLGIGYPILPELAISATGRIDEFGEAYLTIPRLSFDGEIVIDEIGNASLTLPMLTLSMSGAVGFVGTGAVTIPILTLSATGLLSVEGTANLTLPALTLFAEIATAAASYQSMVMNLRNNALSIYSNYPFNSFCRFNGVHLGATSTKIYNLVTGTTDEGTAISWAFKTAFLDLEMKTKKKLRLAWLTLKTDGDLTLTISYPDGTSYDYTATSYETTEDGIRVKFGKGIASRYVALEIKNVAGSTLELDTIRLQLDQYTAKR